MNGRRGWDRLARSLAALLLVPLLIASCTSVPQTDRIRFGAIGDSITASTDRFGLPTHWTWVATAATGDVADVGGYRHYGDTTADILRHVTPLPDAQVVVVMAGTNDAPVDDRPNPRTLTNITAIFEKTGVPLRILSAVAPRNDDRAAVTLELNRELRDLARRSGWTWVDPWTEVRTGDGRWRPHTSVDGIHPTPASGRIAGEVLRAAIVETVTGG
ncbi:Lysophospholipase L1 [Leifsonia sp. 98AMF]|uniref:SGNH/GDSL hydrolase family protein n=1 Tax=unclassified Leifsonia TaxID=2663824 RepID=UPI00087A0ECD|nr:MULTISPECIES: SGNH/GDSL hydrolase family protein [unclassified Leifsonia]SDH28483.1 Lysophospholipase L1 [Leifsonia sp. 197AMF]SDJ09772.1 Lysophospholipase L1 [Leifsonia sp. 466MF]SDJ60783.1 Lysophospholipase L1 [Leifsonia sp. 157MF]SDN31015.1 Lysophospholipase L1 [Leifsonia sp. 509MF]SEM90289.1 Lysophospholipase L1 [Leifsonia sp. 467MF]